ncbi:HmuY family protein [Agaribacterium haliotis]|uniref:HmuY family protein n=1 Tax=Agaribacterium haliotis TaxID=2013869 RepID=UPI000BB5637B|nr:HmuY family protein [Agaribacterium haliotis]
MKKYFFLPLLVCSALLLGACAGGDSEDSDDGANAGGDTGVYQTTLKSKTLDASEGAAYLNLNSGEQVSADETWHLKIDRFNIELGSGVVAALGDAQDDYYNGEDADAVVFQQADADQELESLWAVMPSSDMAYVADSYQPAILGNGGWYDYANGSVTVNDDTYWIVSSSSGESYAQLRVSALEAKSRDDISATFEFKAQAAGESAFSTELSSIFTTGTVAAAEAGGRVCFDFDSGAELACDNADWDIGLEGFDIVLNGGAGGSGSAAAFGPIAAMDIADYSSASAAPARAFARDSIGGLISEQSWYAYAVTGEPNDHGLYPNYRVYVIDTDSSAEADTKFKLQVVNYYSESGASGHVTVRWAELDDAGQ